MILRRLCITVEAYASMPRQLKALVTKLAKRGCLEYSTRCVEYGEGRCTRYATGYFLTIGAGSFTLPIRGYSVSYEEVGEGRARVCINSVCLEVDLAKPKPATTAGEFTNRGVEVDLSDINYIVRLIRLEQSQWEHRCGAIIKLLEYLT
jgi:hypothetical protein